MSIIECQLQLCLNKIQQWLSILKEKTVLYAYMPEKRSPFKATAFSEPNIPLLEETIFLGDIFDRRLSFVPHLKHIKKKVSKALNLLKIIENTEWGADRKVMLRL